MSRRNSKHIENEAQIRNLLTIVNELGGSIFYLDDINSDIGGYESLTTEYKGGSEANYPVASASDGDAIEEFATAIGEPGTSNLLTGQYTVHLHASKTGGTMDCAIYFDIYKRTHPGGVETFLGTSHHTPFFEDADNSLATYIHLPDIEINDTDRIILKFKVAVSGFGLAPSIVMHIQGDTTSRFRLPFTIPGLITGTYTDADAVAAVASADDYVKLVGDIMTGGLTINAPGQKLIIQGQTAGENLEIYSNNATTGHKFIDQLADGILTIRGYHNLQLGANEGGVATVITIAPALVTIIQDVLISSSSLRFDSGGIITEFDTAALAASDTKVPTNTTVKEYVDALNMVGSANAQEISCILHGADPLTAYLSGASHLQNLDGTDFTATYGLPIPLHLAGLDLHIKTMKLGIRDADASDKLDVFNIYGFTDHDSVVAILTDGTDRTTIAEHVYSGGAFPYDLTAYKTVVFNLAMIVTTGKQFEISYLNAECYYA